MLRIIQNTHAAGAKSYYSTADYYLEGQELEGRWRGIGAARLGLTGKVELKDWESLCDNKNPNNGEPLTLRNKTERTVGYDFNFHVPKSVSILYSMTRDERILDAFRDSVDGTMQGMEAEMSTRVRKDGKNENRQTGNMVWGEFIHFTARPVDGLPDPHLHAHCFVFNTTWDKKEEAYKAGQFRNLKRDAPYFEAVFHSRFAHRLGELGLPIERTAKGWELKGIGPATLGKFSRRTQEIEELAREKGIENAEQKAELGAKTRNRKQKNMGFTELQDEWRARMSPADLQEIDSIERRLGGDTEPADSSAAAKGMEYATNHAFERQSVVPERQVLALALRHSVGRARVEDVLQQAASIPFIHGERDGQKMLTTREVLAEEKRVIDFARRGRGTCKPLNSKPHIFKRDWLNDAQKSAVRHIVGSRDRVILLRGAAGVGKTTLMQEAAEAIELSGTRVLAFAPSADASRGVLRDAGFTEADTVSRLLVDKEIQQKAAGQLIWIDEAGLIGTHTMKQVIELAERIDARLLLSGDRRQHASVERGSVLKLLETEAGIVSAEVKEIKRQQGTYKAAVKLLSEQKIADGFNQLDAMGWVKQLPINERYVQMSSDYVSTIAKGQSAIVVSPTHAEGHRITSEIRDRLRIKKVLGKEEKHFTIFETAGLTEAERGDRVNYGSSDVLVFHQNAKGFKKGDRIKFDNAETLPLEHAKRFQAYHSREITFSQGDRIRITQNGSTADGAHRLNNGSIYTIKRFTPDGGIVLAENGWTIAHDFGHLTYGYVVTSHASQGKSVDQVFIGQSSESFRASSREQFYVSVSRGSKKATIYTDDKHALRQQITESDERLSATEFVDGNRRASAIARLKAQQNSIHQSQEPQTQIHRELVYER
jgi:conjugative relaxase-like TrwC/TraI family protein